MNNRVVVTGLGVVTPSGVGVEDFWNNIVNGKNAISKVTRFDTSQFQSDFGGVVTEFDPKKYIKNTDIGSIGRCSEFALAAARMALLDADIEIDDKDKYETSVIMGTTMGECQETERIVGNLVADSDLADYADSMRRFPAFNISNSICGEFGFKGDSIIIPNACAAGNFSISYAYDMIRKGQRKYVLAGGADALSEVAFKVFSRLRTMSPDICRPFDKERKGMMIGEGAGVLFLESMQSALERGAYIYAEIIGYGLSCDAYHMVTPDPMAEGIRRAMQKAIDSAHITSDEIDYICAHGTGTAANDKGECLAINTIFKNGVPASSIKSMIGHTMGAASSIEAAACCLTIRDNIIAPTINYANPDPECDIDCVANKARKKKVNIAANNAYAFGGNNSCVLFKKIDGGVCCE